MSMSQYGASRAGAEPIPPTTQAVELILAWAFVGIPLIWGVVETISNALKLFK